MERERKSLQADLENMETRAVVAEAKVSENEAEKAQEIREREHCKQRRERRKVEGMKKEMNLKS